MIEASAKVFVVDDDHSVRRSLARLLRSVGIDVEAFASATEFLEYAPHEGPSCLVLDLRMPAMSGLDLQRRLAEVGRSVPIVFISGHGDLSTGVRAMKEGAVDFLPKPVDEHDLLDAIRRAVVRDREARLARREGAAVQARFDSLTPRQRQVLALVAAGMPNKQIGAQLGTTEKTIKVHRARVMQKMGARSLADLVRLAERLRLPTPAGS